MTRKPPKHEAIADGNRRVVDLLARGELKTGLAEAVRVERVARQWLGRTDPERAKAICNLACFQQATGARRAALATYGRAVVAMAAACGKNSRFYARVLTHLTSLLIELRRFEEAESRLVAAVWASSHAPDRDEREVAQGLRDLAGLHEMMASKELIDPKGIEFAANALREFQYERNPTVQSARQEIQGRSLPRRKAAQRDLATFLRHFDQEGDYAKALKICWRNAVHGEPFALLLRCFEAWSRVYRAGGIDESGDAQVAFDFRKVGDVESWILDDIKVAMPILTVAAPVALTPAHTRHGEHVPRLVLPDKIWKNVVHKLIRNAHVIVVDALQVASGVSDELEMIARAGRCESTVVLLHRGRSTFIPRPSALSLQAGIFSAPGDRGEPVEEPLTPQHAVLARFPHVGYVDNLKAQPQAKTDLFGPFFASIPMARSATRLNLAGARLFRSGHREDARRYFWASVGAGSALSDWSLRPHVLFNYALTCEELDHVQDSIEAYEASQVTAQALHDDLFQGRGLVMKGVAQLKAGQRDEAFASLWASLGPLEAAGDRVYLGLALETLAKAFMTGGDKTGATAARDELRRWETGSTWHLSDAGAAFRRRAAAVIATPSPGATTRPSAGQGERPCESTKPARRHTRVRPHAGS